MTLEAVYNVLAAVGIPVYYDHTADEAAEMPYIVYREVSTRGVTSDDSITLVIPTVQVELYTTTRNRALEAQLEAAMHGLIWSRQLDFDDFENYYEVIYNFEILGG